MTVGIKVLIVDDVAETCSNIAKLLSFDSEVEVIGEAYNGQQAVEFIERNRPDVVLMDINMPVMDGIEAAEKISIRYPEVSIIMITVQGEIDYMKKAMVAGARDYIIKPFTADQLISSVKKVHQLDSRRNKKKNTERISRPKLITLYSPKGGIGTTTIAVNLAVMMHQLTEKRVILLDMDLQSSDIGVMLDLKLNKSITTIVQNIGYLDMDLIRDCVYKHSSGIDVLLAPPEPQYAEIVKSEHVEQIIKLLKQAYDYIIIDTSSALSTFNIDIMNMSDEILLVLALEITTIRRVKKVIEILRDLNIAGNVRYVLNRSSDEIGLNRKEVEKHLNIKIDNHIISNGRIVVNALNKGIPFVISNHTAKISDDIKKLAMNCAEKTGKVKRRGLFSF